MLKKIIDDDCPYPIYEVDLHREGISTTVDVNHPIPEFVIDNGRFSLHLLIKKEDIAEMVSLFQIAHDYYFPTATPRLDKLQER